MADDLGQSSDGEGSDWTISLTAVPQRGDAAPGTWVRICNLALWLYTCRMSDDRQVFRATPTGNGDLALSGELDALTVPDLNEVLSARNGARHVTLDLSELTFIDSTGLHAIVAYVQSREPDGTVTLTGASPHIVRVLEITRLTDLPKLRIDGAA